MKDDICVVVETLRGEVTDTTFSMLAAGRELANGLNTGLTALLVGHEVQGLAQNLGAADKVACIESSALVDFNPEAYLRVIAECLKAEPPRVVLFGSTAMGTDLACGIAMQLNAPVITSCRTVAVEDGLPTYACLTCGGKIVAQGPIPGPMCVVIVMPGGYKAEQGRIDKTPAVYALATPAVDGARTVFNQYIEPEVTDVDITKESILVSVGRGIQNQDNIELAEKLAAVLGGVVSGSRPVVDQGWLPTPRMVGKSGKMVKPKLYLAVGISGAPEHLEGIPEAETMIAINTDEKAPIFDVAHYGTTADAVELLPALTEKLKQA